MSISGHVSWVSMLCMIISGALSVLLPLAILIYLTRRKQFRLNAFLWGAALFIIFAIVLESILHQTILGGNPQNSFLYKTPIFYMLYGGLAAGIFEETARLIGFKFLLRVKEDTSIATGLSYGLGHGGVEAVLFGGLPVLNNLANAIVINNGMANQVLQTIPQAQIDLVRKTFAALITEPSYLFLVTGFERVVALAVQMSLSIIVFQAVSRKKWSWFVGAILLHAIVDFGPALYQVKVLTSILAVELIILALAGVCVFFAYLTVIKIKKVDE